MIRDYLARAARWVGGMPSVEVHVPVSPTPTFFNMVRCLALSLRKFGGACRDAPIILSVGDDVIDPALADRQPWLGPLGVELRWVPEAFYRAHSYSGTGAWMFEHDDRSDVVLILDADVLVAGPIDAMVRDVHRRQHFAGMMAVASPLLFFEEPTTWADLYAHRGIDRVPDLSHEYVGWPYFKSGAEGDRHGPPYFNFGVVRAPASMMMRIGARYFGHFLRLLERSQIALLTQVALTMTRVELDLPFRKLPVTDDFANDLIMEALLGPELPDARFLHLFGQLQINNREWYADLKVIRETVRRTDLRGVSRRVQQVLAAIEPGLVGDGNSTGGRVENAGLDSVESGAGVVDSRVESKLRPKGATRGISRPPWRPCTGSCRYPCPSIPS